MEIDNNLNGEIDLRDLIFHLIKSKVIVIVTVFIFALMTALYSYILPDPQPIYQTNAKLTVGHIFNQRHDLSSLEENLIFKFPNMTSIREYGDRFLEAKLNGPSVEKNTVQIQELVNFAIDDSKEKISFKQKEFKTEIAELNRQITSIKNTLDLFSIDADNNNVELKLNHTNHLYKKNQLENKLASAKNYLDASYYETTSLQEIKSRQLSIPKDHSKRNILFSAIAGFLLSIIALTLQYAFLKK